MFSDGSSHIEDSGCGCPRCEPERCCDCSIILADPTKAICPDCLDARIAERLGAECAALCIATMTASARIGAAEARGAANDLEVRP